MTQKKTESSKQPSVIESAWDAWRKDRALKTPDDYRKEGWKTTNDLCELMGLASSTVRERITSDPNIECIKVKASVNGVTVPIRLYRPKVLG